MSFTQKVATAQEAVDCRTAEALKSEIDDATAAVLAAVARFIRAGKEADAFLHQFRVDLPPVIEQLETTEGEMAVTAVSITDQLEEAFEAQDS